MSVGFGASLLLTASCLTERTLLQAGKFSCIMKLSTTIQSSIQGDNSGLCGRCPGLKPQSDWLKQCWWLKTTASGGVPPIVLRTRESHSRSPLPPQGEGRKRKGRGKEEERKREQMHCCISGPVSVRAGGLRNSRRGLQSHGSSDFASPDWGFNPGSNISAAICILSPSLRRRGLGGG